MLKILLISIIVKEMFHVLEFEIDILVLCTCIDTSHINLCVINNRWCHGAGSVYLEALPLDSFPNLSCAPGRNVDNKVPQLHATQSEPLNYTLLYL